MRTLLPLSLLLLSAVAVSAQPIVTSDVADGSRTVVLHSSPPELRLSPDPSGATSPLRVGLVLSGGGSRGFAQIGVLRVLEEAGIPIHAVVGTSMGGVVGGLYCGGYTASELDSIVRGADWDRLLGYGDEASRSDLFIDQKRENDRSLLTLRLDGLTPQLPEAVSSGSRITRFIEHLVWNSLYPGERSFDSLRFRFRAVATDIVAGRTVTIDRGNLALAMRASATVPLRFSPIRIDSMLLVDGGLLSNIPVDVARQMGCNIVIVVNTTSPLQPFDQLDEPLNVADQIVTLMMQRPSREELARADFVITPNLADYRAWDFSSIGAIIDSGAATARRQLGAIRALTSEQMLQEVALPNPRFESRDRLLADALDVTIDRDGDAISLQELQRRLDRAGRRGEYSSLAAQVSRYPTSTNIVLSGKVAPEISSIRYSGFSKVDTTVASQHFQGLIGRPLNFDSLRDVCQRTIRSARREGLAFFTLGAIDLDSSRSVLTVAVDEGEIRSIVYTGLANCSELVVERELGLSVGDLFRSDRAEVGINRLLGTGFFAQAALNVRPRSDRGIDLVVEVRERSTAVLRIAATVDNERYAQIGLEIAQENLLGMGTRLGGRFAGGVRDRIVELNLRTNRIYGSWWTFSLTGYGTSHNINSFVRVTDVTEGRIERSITGEYQELRIGGRIRFGRQLSSLGLFSVEGRFERQGARVVSANSEDPRWHNVSSLTFGSRVDTRDRVSFPQQGGVIDISYETSQLIFGATESFAKLSAFAEAYERIGRHVFHPRVQMGFADATLPSLEQFSLGGQRSMFGLREDELRGRQLFLASLEYRYRLPIKIYFDTYVSLRYDLGAAWLAPSQIRLADLEHGLGFSIGLDTPIGPADFSVGESFTVNRPDRPAGVPLLNTGPMVAYFSLGYRFD